MSVTSRTKSSMSSDIISEESYNLEEQYRKSTEPMKANDAIAKALSLDDIKSIQLSISDLNSISDIETLQRKLENDYTLLAKDFSQSRLARIEAYITKIEEIQTALKRDLAEKEANLQDDLPIVDAHYGIEEESLVQQKARQRRRNQFRNSDDFNADQMEDPIEETVLFHLPIFQEWFAALMKPYAQRLKSSKMSYEYEIKLVEDSVRKNIYLIWNECVNRRSELAQDFRRSLNEKLLTLQAEYKDNAKFEMLMLEKKRFRLSNSKAADPVKKRKIQDAQTLENIAIRSIQSRTESNCTSRPMESRDEEIETDLRWIRSAKIEDIEVERYDELLKNFDDKSQTNNKTGIPLELPRKSELVIMKASNSTKLKSIQTGSVKKREKLSPPELSSNDKSLKKLVQTSIKNQPEFKGEDISDHPQRLAIAPQLPSQTVPAPLSQIQHLLPSSSRIQLDLNVSELKANENPNKTAHDTVSMNFPSINLVSESSSFGPNNQRQPDLDSSKPSTVRQKNEISTQETFKTNIAPTPPTIHPEIQQENLSPIQQQYQQFQLHALSKRPMEMWKDYRDPYFGQTDLNGNQLRNRPPTINRSGPHLPPLTSTQQTLPPFTQQPLQQGPVLVNMTPPVISEQQSRPYPFHQIHDPNQSKSMNYGSLPPLNNTSHLRIPAHSESYQPLPQIWSVPKDVSPYRK